MFVSAASTWEIAIKSSIGKIEADLDEVVAECAAAEFTELPVRFEHTAQLRKLPRLHRDPFDRLLVAQALHEGLTLVSRDRVFDDYRVPILWR